MVMDMELSRPVNQVVMGTALFSANRWLCYPEIPAAGYESDWAWSQAVGMQNQKGLFSAVKWRELSEGYARKGK